MHKHIQIYIYDNQKKMETNLSCIHTTNLHCVDKVIFLKNTRKKAEKTFG